MRITIIGCGSIGSKLAKAADEMPEVKRIYLMDHVPGKAEQIASALNKAIVVDSIEEELYHSDLVIEAASQEAAKKFLPKVVSRGVEMMIMSVGSLVDDAFRNSLFDRAKVTGSRIYIPTGAVCGIDGLRAASMGDIDEVELTTVKGPKSLMEVDYLIEKGIDVNSITERTVIFSGCAGDAVKIFPRNINVAATVALLGIGFEKTKVNIVLDPAVSSNSHELRVRGKFGESVAHTFNVPEEDNPKTSHLATLSAISALRRIVRGEWFGI